MNAMEMWEEIKKLCEQEEDLQDELEDIDVKVQQSYTDTGYNFWVILNKDGVQYGEGEIEEPDVSFLATEKVFQLMIDKEAKGGELYLSGDLRIDGSFQKAMSYGSFLGLVNMIAEERKEE